MSCHHVPLFNKMCTGSRRPQKPLIPFPTSSPSGGELRAPWALQEGGLQAPTAARGPDRRAGRRGSLLCPQAHPSPWGLPLCIGTRPEDQPWEPALAQGSWCVPTLRISHTISASSPALGHRVSCKVSVWLKSPSPLLDDTVGTPRPGPASPPEPLSDHTRPLHSLRPQPGPTHQAGG